MQIEKQIESVRKWIDNQIKCIQSYTLATHRQIIICCLIDAFANEFIKSDKKEWRKVYDYLMAFGGKYKNILETKCPVTYCYYCQSEFKLEYRISFQEGEIIRSRDKKAQEEFDKIKHAIKLLGKEYYCKASSFEKKHTYASLIYAMRNKLVHESRMLNARINLLADESEQEPHMVYSEELIGENLTNGKWTLHIPEHFLMEVLKETTENYLEYCREFRRIPFVNEKDYQSWYPKRD